MTTAAIVAAAFIAFPAPNCEVDGRDVRALHYGPTADLELDAAWNQANGSQARGMGGGSRPCELWIRTRLSKRSRVWTAFHEAAHTAGYEHSPEMDRAVRRAVRRFYRPRPNRHTGTGHISGLAVRGGGTN
jgi:hypothetical protein